MKENISGYIRTTLIGQRKLGKSKCCALLRTVCERGDRRGYDGNR